MVVCCILLGAQNSSAQDTTGLWRSLTGVEIRHDYKTVPDFRTDMNRPGQSFYFSKAELDKLGAVDMGAALKYVPSIQIKDYGGVGGIKTISYRSLGASHTAVLLDNNLQINQQTGVINLSSFETFAMNSLEFNTGQPSSKFALASAYLPVSSVLINSELMVPDSSFSVKIYQNFSTINAFETGVLFQTPVTEKSFISAQGFAKYGTGQYNYSYNLSGSDQIYKRDNSDILNTKIRLGGGYKLKKSVLTGTIYYDKNKQQLPGAVILYALPSDQKLNTETSRADLNFQGYNSNFTYRAAAFYQTSKTLYQDPSFLNANGYLASDYKQSISGLGFVISKLSKDLKQNIFFGTDGGFALLESSEFDVKPSRLTLNSVLGFSRNLNNFKIEANLSHQLIQDNARSGDSSLVTNLTKFSPFAGLSYEANKVPIRLRAFYKQAYRLPSFNDLYYNFIGNTNLLPEEAHVTNLGITYGELHTDKTFNFEVSADAYYNAVKNKIVAIPTKNLFNWSMQNIGRTEAIGCDISATLLFKKGFWQSSFNSSHSLGTITDMTNPNSPSYGHQIPYTPTYSSSSSFILSFKGYGLSFNGLYSGKRYSLNENINSNLLAPYFDLNLGVQKSFEFKNDLDVAISLKCMNILNKNYEIIRSFPMPGRFYQLTFNLSFK